MSLFFRRIFSNKGASFLVMQGNRRELSNLNPELGMINNENLILIVKEGK